MTGLSVKLLGPFDARVDGAPLPRLRSRKGQWLLALLALRLGREVARDWLAETLWPDSLTDVAFASLRQSLADLRRALGAAAARISAPTSRTLRLDLPSEAVDAAEFDEAVRRADPTSLERAVGLYRGPLLEGWSEAWVLPERETRRLAYLQAVRTLAGSAAAAGDSAAAIAYLRLGAAADPLGEEIHRELMRLLAREGEYQAAIEAYQDLRRLLYREYNAEPQPETTTLYGHIREGGRRKAEGGRGTREGGGGFEGRPSAFRLPPSAFPCSLGALIGREREVGEIGARLLSRRLVTLVGPGGVGKTRLATEAALQSAGDHAHGACFVDLGALADPDRVPGIVGAALGLAEQAGRSTEDTLVEFLRPRQLLLVLDNCEHLLAACARLTGSLLAHCPGLRILATSRERLGITGEAVWRVPPLEESAAGRLFEERAAAVRPDFRLTDQNTETVARICRRLDGIPLAIELAAALMEALSLEEIAAGLDRRFDLLICGDRTRPERQQTLRAVIDWSHDLLSEPERVLLRRLAVFTGGWTLAAAEAVWGGMGVWGYGGPPNVPRPHTPIPSHSHTPIRPALTSLVAKSLVVAEEVGGKMRYRLLETVREYAAECLDAAGETAPARDRHLEHFLRLAEDAAPALTGPEQSAWLARLDSEYGNLRAGLSWGRSLRLTAALGRYWQIRGYYSEGREWLERALAVAPVPDPQPPNHPITQSPNHTRAEALAWSGFLAIFQGDYEAAGRRCEQSVALWRELGDARGLAAGLGSLALLKKDSGDPDAARALFEESLALSREAGDTPGTASTLGYLGILARDRGDFEEAGRLYGESLALRRRIGDRWGIAASLNNLGLLALSRRRPGEARAYLEESLAIRRELGDRRCIAVSLNSLGSIRLGEGDLPGARACLEESLRIAWDLGEKRGVAYSLEAFARLEAARGRWERTARLAAAAAALRGHIGSPLTRADRPGFERLLEEARGALGAGGYGAAAAAGDTLPLDEAVALALEEEEKESAP